MPDGEDRVPVPGEEEIQRQFLKETGLAKTIARFSTRIAEGVADDLQKKFAAMFATYRSQTATEIQEIIDALREAKENLVDPENLEIDAVIDQVVNLRAGLLELQEGVDDGTGVWSHEVRSEVVRKIVTAIASEC
jgi:hypothetical protein